MISREKFDEYLSEQVGPKWKDVIDPQNGGFLSTKVIHAARLEDIINRTLHQIISNAVQCLYQRGGIRIARSEKEMNLANQPYAPDFLKHKGSIIEGTGKEGNDPIYPSDLGCYGWHHPDWLPGYEPISKALGELQSRFLMKMKGWTFSPHLDEPDGGEWTDELVIRPGAHISDEDHVGSTIIPDNNQQFRFYAKKDEWQEGTFILVNVEQFLSQLDGKIYEAGQLAGMMKEQGFIDGALVTGVVQTQQHDENGQIQLVPEFLGGIYDANDYHKSQDYAGSFSDYAMTETQAMIQARMGFKITMPRTVVTPGQRTTTPRVSPATVNRPLPTIFGGSCEMKVPELTSTALQSFITTALNAITNYETNLELQLQTQPKLKKDVEEKKKRSRECISSSLAILEGFLFGKPISDRVEEVCFDTSDHAARRGVRKYSRKNP